MQRLTGEAPAARGNYQLSLFIFYLILTTKSLREEGHVRLLVRSNLLQVGVERIFEASVHEIFPGVVSETLLIECGLEVLER